MTPYKQLLRHDPENGVWGDCGRTALACILDLPPASVPHFWDGGACGHELDVKENEFLSHHGMYKITFAVTGTLEEVLDYFGDITCGSHYVLVGKSRLGCNHAVVCRGSAIVHDPSQDDTGIVGPCDENGKYAADVFCKIV